jgi:NTE family protein
LPAADALGLYNH